MKLNAFKYRPWVACVALFAALYGPELLAGTGGDTTFQTIYTTLQSWATGTLGKTLALGALVVGIAIGLANQTVIAAAIGVAFAMVLSYGPGVLEGIFAALI